MGCSNSKDPKAAGGSRATEPTAAATTIAAAVPPRKIEPIELFLRSCVFGAESFFKNYCSVLPPDAVRIQATVFLNSLCEFVRLTFRVRLLPAQDLLRSVFGTACPIQLEALKLVEDHVADDGYFRLLTNWENQNTQHYVNVPGKTIYHILKAVGTYCDAKSVPDGTFETVMTIFTKVALANKAVCDLFSVYSPDGLLMPQEEFLNFMRAAQGMENVTERMASDKVRARFGGYVTKLNFASYHSGLITNSAYEPQRATTVWMDMTQPLPRYLISTCRVTSEADAIRALRENVRSLVVAVTRDANGVLSVGTSSLASVLDAIRTTGFKENGYPIILCFQPGHVMDLPMQDEVAALLKEKLGHLLARGVMFEGAMINDPNFSPAALQKKVLVMGDQAPLRPFVGFHVADMNREGLGVRVTDVQGSTPASKAGIYKDDWLTHINGMPILNKDDLRGRLAKLHLGDAFLMKKENLDEVRVVVGGAVAASDVHASQALSNLIFLKVVRDDAKPEDGHYFPWEADNHTGNFSNGSSPSRRDLNDHFLFVSPTSMADSAADYAGDATAHGAQFVDVGGRPDTHVWARGLFSENAHCGYVLKSNDKEEVSRGEVSLKLIAPPSKACNCAIVESKCRIHGRGVCREDDTHGFAFRECDECSVAVLEVAYYDSETNETLRFIAAFPPLLLRGGYRVLPAVEPAEEMAAAPVVHGLFCHIHFSEQSPVMSGVTPRNGTFADSSAPRE